MKKIVIFFLASIITTLGFAETKEVTLKSDLPDMTRSLATEPDGGVLLTITANKDGWQRLSVISVLIDSMGGAEKPNIGLKWYQINSDEPDFVLRPFAEDGHEMDQIRESVTADLISDIGNTRLHFGTIIVTGSEKEIESYLEALKINLKSTFAQILKGSLLYAIPSDGKG